MSEGPELEFKSSVDLDDRQQLLSLVKEIAAMANSGGGLIEVGRADDGSSANLSPDLAAKFDPARVADSVDRFLGAGELEVLVERTDGPQGPTVRLRVPRVAKPPLPMAVEGTYTDGRYSRTLFPIGSVWVRRGTRSVPAARQDFADWIDAAVAAEREAFLERVTLVVEAPKDSTVRVVTDTGVSDPPNELLERQATLFGVRSERLLDGEDLKYLWQHRHGLHTDTPSKRELIVQSAMRKRSTLFPWLAVLDPTAEEVGAWARRAIDMTDRDKSDAGRSILMLAAIYLSEVEYDEIRRGLAASGYAHFREAATDLAAFDVAIRQIKDQVAEAKVDGDAATDVSIRELEEGLDGVVATGHRSAPRLGLAFLARTNPIIGERLLSGG